ncbi:unnamed protein product [Durusdinium trenchii]|uniref:Uncharacterized protein n=1 Tax=Durusdinium trenchii TaxID=1381693 RepID=A0ABP0JKG4_9DINO
MHQEGDTKHLSDYGNLFTQRQLEDLDALAEWAYLATDACIFKALDEDRALTQWWLSPSVHRRNFLGHLNPLWFQNPNQTLIDIFYRVNPEIVQTLTGGALLLLKFTTDMRKALLEPLSPLELYGCVESSWSIVLAAIGIANITKCEELRKSMGVFQMQSAVKEEMEPKRGQASDDRLLSERRLRPGTGFSLGRSSLLRADDGRGGELGSPGALSRQDPPGPDPRCMHMQGARSVGSLPRALWREHL